MPEEDAALKLKREQRFQAEQKKTHKVPQKIRAHPGGNIKTSDKQETLVKLLIRKAKQGIQLTQEQNAAIHKADEDGLLTAEQKIQLQQALNLKLNRNQKEDRPVLVNAPKGVEAEIADKNVRRLEKKVRQCSEILKQRQEGVNVDEHQLAKLDRMEDYQRELEELRGWVWVNP